MKKQEPKEYKSIADFKKDRKAPIAGFPCKTEMKEAFKKFAPLANQAQIDARINGNGEFVKCIIGTGESIWLVKHGEQVAAYLYTEVSDIGE